MEWSPPEDSGGRMDITYNVHCRRCLLEGQKCSPCGSGIHYIPRQFGLPHARVLITDLLPYTNYTFDIEALNGVSEMSFGPKQFISVNITTSQVGKTSDCVASALMTYLGGHTKLVVF